MANKTADEYEAEARVARIRADIAAHVPMTDEEWASIDAVVRDACHSQIPFMEATMDLHSKMAESLSPLLKLNKKLRVEARYWRQRCQDQEKLP